MFHEFVYLYGVVVFVRSMDGETDGANQTSIFTVAVNTNKGRVLAMRMTVVRFNELFKAFRKQLKFSFNI